MIENQEFYNYKKLIIFGNENSGKTSLVKRLEKGLFSNEKHTKEGIQLLQVKYQLILD